MSENSRTSAVLSYFCKKSIVWSGYIAALLVVLLLSAGPAAAQTTDGNIVGTVLDASGAVVPNAAIEAQNVDTGAKLTTQSNAEGQFRFNNVAAGNYNITASAAGFNATSLKGFRVELNKTSTANLKMPVAGTNTTVEVSASGGNPIDTTTAQVTNTFDETAARDLPTSSYGASGVLNLSLLNAGVASPGGLGAGTGPSIGGQRSRNNNFEIEGVDNNNKVVTGPLVFIPNDAVQSFTVLQNQFSPEFGHSSGGQFNTTLKSGTNSFHGVAYEYMQNRNLDAIDNATVNAGVVDANGNPTNPRYDNNRVGGNIGGPVIKNKLFLFGGYEYNPVGQASVPSGGICAPTAAGYATLSSMAGISATNLGVLKQYVAPGTGGACKGLAGSLDPVNGVNIPVAILPIAAPNFQNNKFWYVSGDWNISQADQFRVRYVDNNLAAIDTNATLPAFFLAVPTTNNLFTMSEYHTFTPAVSNEVRVGFNRYNNTTPAGDFKYAGLDSFPNITLNELNLNIGPDPNAPQFTIQNLYSLVDNLTWTKGTHTFKFGGEGHKYISPQSFTQRARGDYVYGTDTSSGLDRWLRDVNPDSLSERSLGDPVFYGDQISVYWYVNDTWRIRPNFTLNLGLRHEYSTIPFGERSQALNLAANVPGLIDFSEPRAPKKNFAPRIGIAWSPGNSGNTSIRAGFGMAYDVLYDNIGTLSLPPQLSGTIDTKLTANTPNFLASGGILPGGSGIQTFATLAEQRSATANHIVVNQQDPYSISWNLGVQHVFAKNYTAEVRYLGSRGVHLNTQDRINFGAVVTPSRNLPTFLAAPSQATLNALPFNLAQLEGIDPVLPAYQPFFDDQPIVQFTPNGGSIYHGLAAQLNRRFDNGLQFQSAYTWSHTIDDSTADFFSTRLTPRRPQDFQNLANDRSTSAIDRRHRFTTAIVYDFPYFKSGNWLKKNLLSNWEIAPIWTIESPELATVQSGTDSNLNGDTAGDRVIFNPAGIPGTGSGVTPLCNSGLPAGVACGSATVDTTPFIVGYLATKPNAQYISAGLGVLPNSGRNTLPTSRINNWDLSLLKRFSFTERTRFEFGGQFFNLFNHPQYTPGYVNSATPTGQATGTPTSFASTDIAVLNYLKPSSGTFNNPKATFASQSRGIQLSAKIIF
jgi:hypothetical protein